jgi:hypothetical protein
MRVSGLVADDDAMVRGVRLQQRTVSAMAGYDRCERCGSRTNPYFEKKTVNTGCCKMILDSDEPQETGLTKGCTSR